MLLCLGPRSSPRPRPSMDINRPSPRSRATSASALMFTIAARSFASSPSGISGNSRKAMSVTTIPSDRVAEELQALVVGGQLLLERVRAVRERQLRGATRHGTGRRGIRSSAVGPPGRAPVPRATDLDRLATRVVPAVPADPVGQLRWWHCGHSSRWAAASFQLALRLRAPRGSGVVSVPACSIPSL